MPDLHVRPYSIAELNNLSETKVDANTPIRLYFRSAKSVLQQARVYMNEGDFQEAYRLYMKYTKLGLSELRKHPKFSLTENKVDIKAIEKNCNEALNAMELMKPKLEARYKDYIHRLEKEKERLRKIKEEEGRQSKLRKLAYVEEKTQVDEEPTNKPWSLQDELQGVVGVGSQTEAAYRQSLDNSSHVYYPGVLQRNQSDQFTYQANTGDVLIKSPPIPRKEPLVPSNVPLNLPPIPPKVHLDASPGPSLPPKIELEVSKDISNDVGDFSDATTENGEPLRRVNTPSKIMERFLEIASTNTNRNLETCGILCGHLKSNELTVTTLLIPKQTSTSDTCTTENEEEVFEYQDRHDLLTLGWIHTHPTQSCFMSSVDLHTHCSYQLMLPEAIAIVCAPKHKPNYGIFRLTDPPGLDVITRCREPRAFHPHPDVPIYTDALDLGHVRMSPLSFNVVDLR
ncbi:hypothetical protein K450DRAFT_227425 [Umbelopsis ramanniana AG]|uniref:MPN domain-containing protein n=1 Tax=Umbelopsis ramanniana AG TaxID=1314678 RepID=A0AAD5EGI3_UMBRA|nr:uncharacterized protein K450DRAFT_227425 [Umbelopsis ramanniana AG]KAI8582491.1 hypothetical protein K450DRAFT_227425 [Umbelopsis ramanniana AG]